MKKRVLSILLALVMVMALLPTAALAAEASGVDTAWAVSAVKALNGIYGAGLFPTGQTGLQENMTGAGAASLLEKMGFTNTDLSEDILNNLTRETACDVLADVFGLPVGSGSAIQYLQEKNIISGKADGTADKAGALNCAEFAVLTYRVLNLVGGGLGSSGELAFGSEEYFAWMYLAARGCVDLEETGTSDTIDQNTWNGWVDKLKEAEDASNTFAPSGPDAADILEAAVELVEEYIKAGGSETIFSDVDLDDEYYDGVIYLFDRGLVSVACDGTFAGASDNGLMEKLGLTGKSVTREKAVVAVLEKVGVDVSNVNTRILERFTDRVSSGNEKYIAYAVAAGLLDGSGDSLGLSDTITLGELGALCYRAQLGVDETKMHDYWDLRDDVLTEAGEGGGGPVPGGDEGEAGGILP